MKGKDHHQPMEHNALHGREMQVFRRAKHQAWLIGLFVLLLLVVDQASKFLVKLHMPLGEEIPITGWFSIYFIENPGMAYGLQLGSKLVLSIFRIIAMGLLAWGIVRLLWRRTYRTGFLMTLALILAGGLGNILDSAFYGLIFSESAPGGAVATLFSEGGGYATFLHGRVVDMLYFPLIDIQLPSWLPWLGGQRFTFFDPVFNIADSCITIGVLMLLLFYTRSLSQALDSITSKKGRKKAPSKEPNTSQEKGNNP